MSNSTEQHRQQASASVGVGIITVSDTRTMENDLGGQLIQDLSTDAGHRVVDRRIVPDESDAIRIALLQMLGQIPIDAVLLTGGTGLAERDRTPEAVEKLYDGWIPGYGELFRMLSWHEIGPASMLSRASGGRIGKKVVLTMPGSPAGVRLALEKLIIPELAHLVFHAGK
jgi:molybdenum cofactor biosynthesis protein B